MLLILLRTHRLRPNYKIINNNIKKRRKRASMGLTDAVILLSIAISKN